MTAAWVTAAITLAGILGLLIRLSFQVGQLVQRFGDHVTQSEKTFGDQEMRIRRLEASRGRSPR